MINRLGKSKNIFNQSECL